MAKRLVLFSQPSPSVWKKLDTAIFPDFLKKRVIAYMPSDGNETEINASFEPIWYDFAEKNNSSLIIIDNSKRGDEAKMEVNKLQGANILMITGGNTYKLLNHLRLSGLDNAIIKFWQKDNVVLSGFSAGALVLTPSIEIAGIYGDVNEPDLTDFGGLGIVDFEIWAHYDPNQDKKVEEYKQVTKNDLKLIGDEEVVVIDN
jgi:dipeptidase E